MSSLQSFFVITKRGASCDLLLKVLKNGQIPPSTIKKKLQKNYKKKHCAVHKSLFVLTKKKKKEERKKRKEKD